MKTRIYTLLSCLFLLVMTQGVKAQADLCSGVGAGQTLTINANCTTTAYNVAGGWGDEIADPTCSGSERDGWFRVTPAAGQTTIMTRVTVGGGHNAGIALYTGTCGSLSQLDCINTGGANITETLISTVTPGTTYYIRIFRTNAGTGDMTGTICITTPAITTACSGTFTDNGGGGANYSANSSNLYTYCPGTAGQCVRAAFTSFSTEASNDVLVIYNGPTPYADPFGNYSGGTSPGTITASNPSGCLTFRFQSDGGTQAAGWSANISCVACPTTPPAAAQDCFGGATVCSDEGIPGASAGSGTDADLTAANRGCLNVEHQSSWYYFSPSASGVLALNITPAVTSDDYDFAIWGPMSGINCPPNVPPTRCSYSSVDGITGLNTSAAGEFSEGASGDGFVDVLNVVAGQKYIMLIDNYTSTTTPFTIDWTTTGGASLNCVTLPVQMANFTAEAEGNKVKIDWMTMSELKCDYFTVEKSPDGINFFAIDKVPGAGTSSGIREYRVYDQNPLQGMNYYRLKQTDFDGQYTYTETVPVQFGSGDNNIPVEVFPVPATEMVNVLFSEEIPENTSIFVLDVTGRILFTQTLDPGNGRMHAVSLNGLNRGIYFLRAENEGGNKKSSLKKIIVE